MEMIVCENFPDPYDISREENPDEGNDDENDAKETHPPTLLS